jgi:hypothetical protein
MQAFETAAPAPAFGRTAFADFVSAGLLSEHPGGLLPRGEIL